jgi:hypothetical protein
MGLRADGAARRLDFAPHLPASWDKVTLRRVRVGDSRITLELTQAVGEVALRISNDGAPLKIAFDPELPLGAKIQNARLADREIAATFAEHAQDAHAHVGFDVPRGDSVLRLTYSGGVAIVPPATRPVVGERSRGMKIVGVSLKDRAYTIELDHVAAETASFELRTPWQVESVRGAKFAALTSSSYQLSIEATPTNDKRAYQRSTVTVTFARVE